MMLNGMRETNTYVSQALQHFKMIAEKENTCYLQQTVDGRAHDSEIDCEVIGLLSDHREM